ncbi:MAG: hypothetical protein PF545_02130 [Elusimicrobia bacterium]|jgi:hypothetical protein|nr:hypothetical protein [Elusimicrobiota bacterium]
MSRFKFISGFLILFFIYGCGGIYNSRMTPVKDDVTAGNYEKALKSYKKTGLKDENKSSLLYHLEAGILYHLAGEYKTSNYFLERAEWLADELYTKSLSGEAAALMTSDKTLPYRGEYYDYLYTNYYKLLNYLSLGKFEDALVEVRRINHKLSLFEQEPEPFLHFITAILYDYNNQTSDAFIEYKKAYQAYSNPSRSLLESLSLFCSETNFARCSEIKDSRIKKSSAPEDYGTVIFISETGFVPHKIEKRTEAAIPPSYRKKHPKKLKDIYYMTIAVPEYSAPLETVKEVELVLNGEVQKFDLGRDISGMVLKNFQNEEPKIMAKAIARAVTKYITYKSVKGKESDKSALRNLLGTSVNIIGAVTEQADTRSWLTLPGKIFITRKDLKPGDYNFRLNYLSDNGLSGKTLSGKALSGKDLRGKSGNMNFALESGELKFIVIRK